MVRATEKIIEGLTEFMEGFLELQRNVEAELGAENGFEAVEDDDEAGPEVEAALVTEVRAAIESVMDAEDYSAEEVATAASMLTDALEEIDPDLFVESEEEEQEEEEEIYGDDDIDYDDDEDYEDYDEDEDEDEEEDEDEYDEEDEDDD